MHGYFFNEVKIDLFYIQSTEVYLMNMINKILTQITQREMINDYLRALEQQTTNWQK